MGSTFAQVGGDFADGGVGDDILSSGAGTDTLLGGKGEDVFMLVADTEVNSVQYSDVGTDVLNPSSFGTAFDSLAGIIAPEHNKAQGPPSPSEAISSPSKTRS